MNVINLIEELVYFILQYVVSPILITENELKNCLRLRNICKSRTKFNQQLKQYFLVKV